MAYTLEEFERDYDPEEHYMEAEDECSFLFCLHRAWNGDAEHQAIMGMVYSSAGHGVKVDYKKAEYFFLRAIEQGHAKAGYELGWVYLNKLENYKGAFELFTFSAEKGYNPAIASLGKCYFYGLGTELDWEKAKFWLLKSVKNDTYESPFYLALCLRDKDVRSAIGFAKIACEHNYPQAYGVLADLLYGEGEYYDAGEWLKLGAKRGNADAQKQLASWYENGMAVCMDLTEACIWYGRAMRLGDEEAKENYERLLKEVDDDDHRLRVEQLEWRSQDNDTEAMIHLGDSYIYGFYGLPVNEKKGLRYYMRAGLNGNADGLFLTASYFFNKEDYENGFKWMTRASNRGHIMATLDLAGRYRDGAGTEADYEKAYKLYDKALDMSKPDSYEQGFAYLRLGDFHYFGIYVERDYRIARDYYQKAIASGHSGAYVRLGDMCYYGLGGERDTKRAYELYKAKAYENHKPFEVPPESWDASMMYKSGGDYDDLYHYNARADLGLGNCRFFGEGTEKDLKRATQNYLLAWEHSYPEAGYNLALCYFYGAGVRKNIENTKRLLIRTAEVGYEKSKILYKEIFGEDI